jgi:hypothetical protein
MIAVIASADNAAFNEIFFKTVPPDAVSPGDFRGCFKARSRDLHFEFESFCLARKRDLRFKFDAQL